MAVVRTEQAVVPDLDEAVGQDVLEKPTNKLLCGERAEPGPISSRVLELEGDDAVLEAENAAVADGNAKDVRGEILQGGFARADRFGVNDFA